MALARHERRVADVKRGRVGQPRAPDVGHGVEDPVPVKTERAPRPHESEHAPSVVDEPPV